MKQHASDIDAILSAFVSGKAMSVRHGPLRLACLLIALIAVILLAIAAYFKVQEWRQRSWIEATADYSFARVAVGKGSAGVPYQGRYSYRDANGTLYNHEGYHPRGDDWRFTVFYNPMNPSEHQVGDRRQVGLLWFVLFLLPGAVAIGMATLVHRHWTDQNRAGLDDGFPGESWVLLMSLFSFGPGIGIFFAAILLCIILVVIIKRGVIVTPDAESSPVWLTATMLMSIAGLVVNCLLVRTW